MAMLSSLISFLLALLAFQGLPLSKGNPWIEIGEQKLAVEIADNPLARARGLSDRASLEPNEGMLFVFESASQPGFWMKEMNFPIDIIWIAPDQTILGWENDVAPETYPRTFYPPAPIRWVLEVHASNPLTDQLRLGERVKFESNAIVSQ